MFKGQVKVEIPTKENKKISEEKGEIDHVSLLKWMLIMFTHKYVRTII